MCDNAICYGSFLACIRCNLAESMYLHVQQSTVKWDGMQLLILYNNTDTFHQD